LNQRNNPENFEKNFIILEHYQHTPCCSVVGGQGAGLGCGVAGSWGALGAVIFVGGFDVVAVGECKIVNGPLDLKRL